MGLRKSSTVISCAGIQPKNAIAPHLQNSSPVARNVPNCLCGSTSVLPPERLTSQFLLGLLTLCNVAVNAIDFWLATIYGDRRGRKRNPSRFPSFWRRRFWYSLTHGASALFAGRPTHGKILRGRSYTSS